MNPKTYAILNREREEKVCKCGFVEKECARNCPITQAGKKACCDNENYFEERDNAEYNNKRFMAYLALGLVFLLAVLKS